LIFLQTQKQEHVL